MDRFMDKVEKKALFKTLIFAFMYVHVCVCPSACVMKLLHTLTSQSAPVLSCAFSSDGELVVSG